MAVGAVALMDTHWIISCMTVHTKRRVRHVTEAGGTMVHCSMVSIRGLVFMAGITMHAGTVLDDIKDRGEARGNIRSPVGIMTGGAASMFIINTVPGIQVELVMTA